MKIKIKYHTFERSHKIMLMKKQLVLIALFVLLLASCTMQKRYHNSGFHITWLGSGKKTEINRLEKKNKEKDTEVIQERANNQQETLIVLSEINANQETADIQPESLTSPIAKKSSSKRNKNAAKSLNYKTEYQHDRENSDISVSNPYAQKSKDKKNSILFLMLAAMGLSTIGLMKSSTKTGHKLTKWARNNPFNAQVGITGLQVALSGLGLYSGYNLHKMGIDFSF